MKTIIFGSLFQRRTMNIHSFIRFALVLLLLTAAVIARDNCDYDNSVTLDSSHSLHLPGDSIHGGNNIDNTLLSRDVPSGELRRRFGFAIADPLNADDNIDESPIRSYISKDMLDILAMVYGETRTVVGYLWHYGFLPKVMNKSLSAAESFTGLIPPCAVIDALREFQRFNNIVPANGLLSEETRDLMRVDRCGNADVECDMPECASRDGTRILPRRKKRYVLHSRSWRNKQKDGGEVVLNYFFDPEHMYDVTSPDKQHHDQGMSEKVVKDQVEKGLRRWTKYAPIRFVEVDKANEADITIMFGKYQHGEKKKKHFFDGESGILAHMFFPPSGKMHFDESENFTTATEGDGINLETIAAHEMGHGLGIKHSSHLGSIMTPYYIGYVREFKQDDIQAVQSLYGVGTGSVIPLSEQRVCVAGEWRKDGQCLKCPPDTYSDRENAKECLSCPINFYDASTVKDCITNISNEIPILSQVGKWLKVKRQSKIPLDMRSGSLEIKTGSWHDANLAKFAKGGHIGLSLFSETGWIGALRLFVRENRLYFILKFCTPSRHGYYIPQPITYLDKKPPKNLLFGDGDEFTITISTQELKLSVNGMRVLNYDFDLKSGRVCSHKYREPVAAVVFWKIDSISRSYRYSQMQLFET